MRPIACGELLCRLVEVCLLEKVLPSPLQVGVQVRDSTTHVAMVAAHLYPIVKGAQGYGFLQIDLVNAFNTVSRDAIFR